ncbi:hypothetical protein BpHYR1_029555, partial [Brachionus plicatilis]
HATCPVCRNNINGEESSTSANSTNLLNENGPAFFNIIPFNSDETIATSSTTSSGPSSIAQSNPRRNAATARNQSLYRIHIRPRLNTGVAQIADLNDEEPISSLRSGVRVRAHLSSDPQTESSGRRPTRLNFGQMMNQFVSRHPSEDAAAERESDMASSIRVTTRLEQPSNSNQRSRYSNVMNYLINQIQERSGSVNRSEENFLDDDVIELEQENSQNTDADESNQTPTWILSK